MTNLHWMRKCVFYFLTLAGCMYSLPCNIPWIYCLRCYPGLISCIWLFLHSLLTRLFDVSCHISIPIILCTRHLILIFTFSPLAGCHVCVSWAYVTEPICRDWIFSENLINFGYCISITRKITSNEKLDYGIFHPLTDWIFSKFIIKSNIKLSNVGWCIY
jgi:hypothetical protein